MFWMNLIKKFFLGEDYESEKSRDALQLIIMNCGAEREALPPEYCSSFGRNYKS